MESFTGRTAIVTGAARGIGAVARLLAQRCAGPPPPRCGFVVAGAGYLMASRLARDTAVPAGTGIRDTVT